MLNNASYIPTGRTDRVLNHADTLVTLLLRPSALRLNLASLPSLAGLFERFICDAFAGDLDSFVSSKLHRELADKVMHMDLQVAMVESEDARFVWVQ